jgi:serine/threonine protein kinase/Tol biopolymer transport system component
MGEVYRATDSRLGRDVALKILPAAFALDPDRLARFKREAQVLASLNHPHIAAIYGFEELDGVKALVLELVDGPTLADRIAQGPIPVDETLPIARQIAEALEAAHEQGIIHRDLKPANIKFRPDGAVKVLDFGLAKALDVGSASLSNERRNGVVTVSPTITTPAMTELGVILGTAAYMSPEQAKGRAADKRCDIWAFGCVLFEMLTGRRAFEGEDVSDTLASVLKSEPDWAALPIETPAAIRALLRRCLEKDRRRRLGGVSAALFAIDEQADLSATIPRGRGSPTRATLWKRAIVAALTSAIGVALVMIAMSTVSRSPAAVVARFSYAMPDAEHFTDLFLPAVAISPDGSEIAYVANQRLHVRPLSELTARTLPGTEATTNMGGPVFSPDSASIVYWTRTGPGNTTGLNVVGVLKRVATSGGASVTIAQINNVPHGISWYRDALIIGQMNQGIVRVPAIGGKPEVLVRVNSGEAAVMPQMLPGGDAVLFTLMTEPPEARSSLDTWDRARIVVQSLKSGERRTLVEGGSGGRYLPTGHLVYALSGSLFAVRVDIKRLEVVGSPVPIVEGVLRTGVAILWTGSAHFSVSDSGSLVYIPGPTAPSQEQRELVVMDRTARIESLKLPARPYESPRVSPDGKRLAVHTDDGKEAIVWTYDLSGATSMRRLTLEGKNRFPIWSPDGQRVAFQSDRERDAAIFAQRADGSAPAERLTKADEGTAHLPESWSPDGKTLLFTQTRGSTSTLWAFSFENRKAAPFDAEPSTARSSASFSPDGRWVAYGVRKPDALSQIVVQPFPATGAKYVISDDGFRPQWSPDGRELIFERRQQAVAASVSTTSGFAVGNPVALALAAERITAPLAIGRPVDMMPDGRRFVAVVSAGDATTARGTSSARQIQIVLNWTVELKQRVPAR